MRCTPGDPAARCAKRTEPCESCMLLLAASLDGCTAGCRDRTIDLGRRLADLRSAINPVGPVPGAVQMSTTALILRNDPVALQDGRRLFNWYNCSGATEATQAAAWGPACAIRLALWQSRRSDLRLHRAGTLERHAGLGIEDSRRIRYGNWWRTSNRCERRRSPIRLSSHTDEKCPIPMDNTVLGVGTQSSATGRR